MIPVADVLIQLYLRSVILSVQDLSDLRDSEVVEGVLNVMN